MNVFRSIGETIPAAKNEQNPYRVGAGFGRLPLALRVAGFLRDQVSPAPCFSRHCSATATLFNRGEGAGILLPLVCGAGLGFMVPDRVLASRVKARAQRLRSAIPPALDLIVLGLEAGQSLDQSIADSSRSLKRTHPDFSTELAQLYLELKTGSSRAHRFPQLSAGAARIRNCENWPIC